MFKTDDVWLGLKYRLWVSFRVLLLYWSLMGQTVFPQQSRSQCCHFIDENQFAGANKKFVGLRRGLKKVPGPIYLDCHSLLSKLGFSSKSLMSCSLYQSWRGSCCIKPWYVITVCFIRKADHYTKKTIWPLTTINSIKLRFKIEQEWDEMEAHILEIKSKKEIPWIFEW